MTLAIWSQYEMSKARSNNPLQGWPIIFFSFWEVFFIVASMNYLRCFRSFGAKLLANAHATMYNKNKVAYPAPQDSKKVAPVPKPVAKKTVIVKPEPELNVISPDTEQVKQKEKASAKKKKKKLPTMSAVLAARSKAACGLSDKPKEQTVDIDASDENNELTVVEYIEDLYKFYKLTEVSFISSSYDLISASSGQCVYDGGCIDTISGTGRKYKTKNTRRRALLQA